VTIVEMPEQVRCLDPHPPLTGSAGPSQFRERGAVEAHALAVDPGSARPGAAVPEFAESLAEDPASTAGADIGGHLLTVGSLVGDPFLHSWPGFGSCLQSLVSSDLECGQAAVVVDA